MGHRTPKIPVLSPWEGSPHGEMFKEGTEMRIAVIRSLHIMRMPKDKNIRITAPFGVGVMTWVQVTGF